LSEKQYQADMQDQRDLEEYGSEYGSDDHSSGYQHSSQQSLEHAHNTRHPRELDPREREEDEALAGEKETREETPAGEKEVRDEEEEEEVYDDGTGRFFLNDSEEMQEIDMSEMQEMDMSSCTASSDLRQFDSSYQSQPANETESLKHLAPDQQPSKLKKLNKVAPPKVNKKVAPPKLNKLAPHLSTNHTLASAPTVQRSPGGAILDGNIRNTKVKKNKDHTHINSTPQRKEPQENAAGDGRSGGEGVDVGEASEGGGTREVLKQSGGERVGLNAVEEFKRAVRLRGLASPRIPKSPLVGQKKAMAAALQAAAAAAAKDLKDRQLEKMSDDDVHEDSSSVADFALTMGACDARGRSLSFSFSRAPPPHTHTHPLSQSVSLFVCVCV